MLSQYGIIVLVIAFLIGLTQYAFSDMTKKIDALRQLLNDNSFEISHQSYELDRRREDLDIELYNHQMQSMTEMNLCFVKRKKYNSQY